MKSGNITATDGRLNKVLDRKINQVINKRNFPEMIEKTVNDAKIHTGVMLKYYPYKDKAYVKLSNNKEVVCKILHRLDGGLIDFYTPEGESAYCEILKERCIIPRAKHNVLVVDINDDSDEQLMLGFFQENDILYIAPADNGCYKISNINATNEFGVTIGRGKVDIKSLDGVGFTQGVFPEDEKVITYSNSENTPTNDDVYTRDELYTKEEVDELISKAIDDLRKELKPEQEESNTTEGE